MQTKNLQMMNALEQATSNREAMRDLQAATSHLSATAVDSDTVAATMDDAAEAMAEAQELADVVAMDMPGGVDDVSFPPLSTACVQCAHVFLCTPQFDLEDELGALDADIAASAPVAAAPAPVAAPINVPAATPAGTPSTASMAAAAALPLAPSATLPQPAVAQTPADDMDDELRALEADMGM